MILVLILQSVVVYVLVTRLILPRQAGPEAMQKTVQKKSAEDWPRVPIPQPLLYDMGDIVVNPKDPESLRYLSTHIVLQVDSPDVLKELEDKLVASKVQDLVRGILSATPTSKMNEADDRKALREQLKTALNTSDILTSGQVTAVFFERFLLQ